MRLWLTTPKRTVSSVYSELQTTLRNYPIACDNYHYGFRFGGWSVLDDVKLCLALCEGVPMDTSEWYSAELEMVRKKMAAITVAHTCLTVQFLTLDDQERVVNEELWKRGDVVYRG